MDAALRELLSSCNLSQLETVLSSETLAGLEARLEAEGRPQLLAHLKATGVAALGNRQGLVNALSKAKRTRDEDAATAASDAASAAASAAAAAAAAAPPAPSSVGKHSVPPKLPAPPVASKAPPPLPDFVGFKSGYKLPSAIPGLDPSRPPPMPLQYKLHVPSAPPAAGRRPPLVLLLHGSGASEEDLLPLAESVSEHAGGAVVASLRAPHQQLGGYAWFHGNSAAPPPAALETEIGASADAIVRFLEAAPVALQTDAAAAHVLGFSQGATIGWALLLMRWPRADLLSGAVLASGRAMPELLQPSTALGARTAARGELARRPKVLAFHAARPARRRLPLLSTGLPSPSTTFH